jgi:hypothetical protein
MTSTLSMTGKNTYNAATLSGKSYNSTNDIPLQIKNIKTQILKQYLVPLINNNWEELKKNLFFLENIKNKINDFYDVYKLDDLLLYKDILSSIDRVMIEHKELMKIEQAFYGTKNESKIISSVFYKTKHIKLKPEYEIYDFIFDKQKKPGKIIYDTDIIDDIKGLLKKPNINYNSIEYFIKDKYKNTFSMN